MRLLLSTTAAATIAATAAFASGPVAPQPYVAPVNVPMPSAYNWAGGYAGFGLTYGRANMDEQGGAPDVFPDANGAGVSLLGGYNWQNGNLVYGAEAALDFSNRSGDFTDAAGNTITTEADHSASIRGRIGYAADRTLFFATAGYGIDNRAVLFNGTEVAGGGWHGPMLGIGAETVLSGAWNLRGDLEYYFYGDEDVAGIPVNGDTSMFRMSLIRRF